MTEQENPSPSTNYDPKLARTELVYTTALGWADDRFEYWIERAEREFDWKLLRAPDLANTILDRDVIVVGGSGRHAFAAVRKGFRNVTYVDLTEGNIARADRLAQEHGIKNLATFLGDFLEWESTGHQADLVVMNGVMQHVSAPDYALRKAVALANEGGVVYFDCYSAGSLYFLINEWLRTFFGQEAFDYLMRQIDLLGLDAVELSYTTATMTERLSDDLFVPYIACYVEQHIVDTLVAAGFDILHRDYCPIINHNLPRYDSYQFLVRRTGDSDPSAIQFEPTSNFDMDYSLFPFVEPTLRLMRSVSETVASDRSIRDTVTFGLMLRFHDWTARKLDGRTAHAELREYLRQFSGSSA